MKNLNRALTKGIFVVILLSIISSCQNNEEPKIEKSADFDGFNESFQDLITTSLEVGVKFKDLESQIKTLAEDHGLVITKFNHELDELVIKPNKNKENAWCWPWQEWGTEVQGIYDDGGGACAIFVETCDGEFDGFHFNCVG